MLGVLAAGAGAIVACGVDGPGAGALERQIPALVAPQAPSVVTDVVCPDGVPDDDGAITRCRAWVDGVAVEVQVTRRDGVAAVRLDRALLVLDDVEATVAGRLTSDLGVAIVVRCEGARVRAASDGLALRCSGTDPSKRERPIEVAVDASGSLSVRFA
jgi:hypothetical protein